MWFRFLLSRHNGQNGACAIQKLKNAI